MTLLFDNNGANYCYIWIRSKRTLFLADRLRFNIRARDNIEIKIRLGFDKL
jgi:hypothetical protein